MICLLCLQKSVDSIKIFDEENGLNVASIITKHFWLNPKENDTESKYVCYECWHIIKSFHIFYTKIEVAHKNLTNIVCKIDPLEVSANLIKIEIEDTTIRNDNIGQNNTANLSNTNNCSYNNNNTKQNQNAKTLPNSSDTMRRTRRSVKYSESPKQELIALEIGKRKRRNKKIDTTTTILPLTPIPDLPPVTLLQIDTIKAEDDSDYFIPDDEADQLDNDDNNLKIKLKRRRNVLRTADKVDEKISKFMQLNCELCQVICPTLAALKAHFRTVHEKKGYAICCKKKFFKRYLLIDHIDTHINPEHFKCTECDKIFTVADCLKRHIQEMHKSEKCFYYCDKCPKKFVRQLLLDRHKAHHNPIEMWTFICDDCGKAFPSQFYLKSHKTFTHNKLPNKICHVCGKAVQSNRYKKHIMEHDGITEPKIQCEICGAWLVKKYMGTHKINHREAEVIHSCTICGKISPNRRALYIHMRYTHAEERNHECTVCSKTFKRRLALKQHMATHTGDNLYKCPYCPKSFTYDSNFHLHKKRDHPKEHEEERKQRNQRTDFVKCTQEKLQQTTSTKFNERYDSLGGEN